MVITYELRLTCAHGLGLKPHLWDGGYGPPQSPNPADYLASIQWPMSAFVRRAGNASDSDSVLIRSTDSVLSVSKGSQIRTRVIPG